MKYPLLFPTIGHGTTDLIDNPKLTLLLHSGGLLTIKFIPIYIKKFILITSSIFHIKRDMPLYLSIFLHILWLKFPILSKTYLSFIHTPIHYIRSYYLTPKKFKFKFIIGVLSSICLTYGIEKNFDINIEKYLGKFWWISPILIHIFITEYIIYNNSLNLNKRNKLNLVNILN